MFRFLAICAGLVANLTHLRRINSKLDSIMADQSANQQDLDNKLAELKTQIGETAQRVSDKLGSLVQSSPTFNAEVADLQNDLALLAAIAPAAQAANAATPAPGAPKEAGMADAHPEIVKPDADVSADRPENTDTTPQVQKDAATLNNPAAPVNAPVNAPAPVAPVDPVA